MKIIKEYLQNPNNYQKGVDLYQTFGSSNILKSFFKMGENPISWAKLLHNLGQIVEAEQAALKQLVGALKPLDAIKKLRAERDKLPSDADTAPPAIKRLIEQRKNLYKKRAAFFAELKLMCRKENETKFEDEQRGKISAEILHIGLEIDTIWKQTTHYDQYLTLPETPTKLVFEVKSDIDTMKQLNRLRVKISQAKAGKRKTTDLANLEAERDFLEKLIEENENDVVVS